MNHKYSIAIDGPSGAGKSTLAKALAQILGFLYVDTGAIYRTVGLYVARQGGNCAREEEVLPCLPQIRFNVRYDRNGLQHMYLQEEDVTEAIRDNQVSLYASQVSAIPAVRTFLLERQREMAQNHDVIMDGRDIGTVVLPQADLKIFLTASAQQRAKRRYQELKEKGENISFDTVLEELLQRDYDDIHRETAPLKQAADAVELDTSHLDLAESLTALRVLVKERLSI